MSSGSTAKASASAFFSKTKTEIARAKQKVFFGISSFNGIRC